LNYVNGNILAVQAVPMAQQEHSRGDLSVAIDRDLLKSTLRTRQAPFRNSR
jgi:hypothetical protein